MFTQKETKPHKSRTPVGSGSRGGVLSADPDYRSLLFACKSLKKSNGILQVSLILIVGALYAKFSYYSGVLILRNSLVSHMRERDATRRDARSLTAGPLAAPAGAARPPAPRLPAALLPAQRLGLIRDVLRHPSVRM